MNNHNSANKQSEETKCANQNVINDYRSKSVNPFESESNLLSVQMSYKYETNRTKEIVDEISPSNKAPQQKRQKCVQHNSYNNLSTNPSSDRVQTGQESYNMDSEKLNYFGSPKFFSSELQQLAQQLTSGNEYTSTSPQRNQMTYGGSRYASNTYMEHSCKKQNYVTNQCSFDNHIKLQMENLEDQVPFVYPNQLSEYNEVKSNLINASNDQLDQYLSSKNEIERVYDQSQVPSVNDWLGDQVLKNVSPEEVANNNSEVGAPVVTNVLNMFEKYSGLKDHIGETLQFVQSQSLETIPKFSQLSSHSNNQVI